MASKSHLEEEFAFWLKVDQMPDPEREYEFAPPRRWRWDFSWPDRKVAVEIEGILHGDGGRHQRLEGFVNDAEKHEAALLHGWKVYRIPGPWIAQGSRQIWRPQVMETLRMLLGVQQ